MTESRGLNTRIACLIVLTGVVVGAGLARVPPAVACLAPLAPGIVIVERTRPDKARPWDLLTFLNWGYLLVFVVCPIASAMAPTAFDATQVGVAIGGTTFSDAARNPPLSAFVAIYVGYICVLIGWHARRSGARRSVEGDLVVRQERAIVQHARSGEEHVDVISHVSYLMFGLLAFGLASLFLYGRIYGGLSAVVRHADAIRANIGAVYATGPGGKLKFVRNFIPLVIVAAWCGLSLVLPWRSHGRVLSRRPWTLPLLVASILAVAAEVLVRAGRSDAVMFLIPSILAPFAWHHRRTPPKSVTVLAFLVLAAWIIVGHRLFAQVAYHTRPSYAHDIAANVAELLSSFSTPYVSLIAALRAVPEHVPFRLFVDFVNSIFAFVPKQLFGFGRPMTVSDVNTRVLGSNLEGGYPPGLLAGLTYDLGIAGVIFGCALLGRGLALADRLFRRRSGRLWWYVYGGFGISVVALLTAGDPFVYIESFSWLLLGIVVVGIFGRQDDQGSGSRSAI